MFHRSLHSGIPDFLPKDISLPEVKQFLISTRDGGHYGIDQERRFEMCALRRLGPPLLGKDTESTWNVRGRSQADIPTKKIVSSSEGFINPARRLWLETDGNIIFPDSWGIPSDTCQGLTPSMVKLGRFIENLDRPSEVYFDSELSSYLEGAVWAGDQGLYITPLEPDTPGMSLFEPRIRYLTTDAIKFRWSIICSHVKMDPAFAESSDKELLTEWISGRKSAFLITAYQTCVNARIWDTIWQPKGRFKNFQDRVSSFSRTPYIRPCKFGESTYPSVPVMNLQD